MDQTDTPVPACRHDGWTPERRTLFLETLAAKGNVSAACARAQMSREAAYRLRRRDVMFMRGWNAALLLARDSVADTLGDRAIDGIEEKIYYRGELIDTRRKYDTRLLLAHMARLDKLAEEQDFDEAFRFDELLACNAGAPVPEALDCEEGELPPDRHEFVGAAAADVRQRIDAKWAEAGDENGELTEEDFAAYEAECEEATEHARLEAAARWDDWQASACAAIDALRVADPSPWTPSGSSTSPVEKPAMPAPGDPAGPFSSIQTARRTG
jgi:hypothetical protein